MELGISTNPDDSKDKIDCGSGKEGAWINVSADHVYDAAVDCEIARPAYDIYKISPYVHHSGPGGDVLKIIC